MFHAIPPDHDKAACPICTPKWETSWTPEKVTDDDVRAMVADTVERYGDVLDHLGRE